MIGDTSNMNMKGVFCANQVSAFHLGVRFWSHVRDDVFVLQEEKQVAASIFFRKERLLIDNFEVLCLSAVTWF